MDIVRIGNRAIGGNEPPYIVAELSGNHNGDLNRALKLIDAAKDAGADAVKIQTYTADTLTIDHDGPGFRITSGLWKGRTLYDLYQQASTPWAWHPVLFEHAAKIGITLFSSPFDETAVDLLEKLNTPAFKIASFEIVDLPLIARCARTGKPLIISTGMANQREIADAVATAQSNGAGGLVLLHCVSAYPSKIEDMNLASIGKLSETFHVPVGLSDHSMGVVAPSVAVSLGAALIEKHFTLRRADGGIDSEFSLESDELAELVRACRAAHLAIGQPLIGPVAAEEPNLTFRRSLYVVRDMAAGEKITTENVRSIRPGFGLPPKHLSAVIGRAVCKPVTKGTPLSWDLLSD